MAISISPPVGLFKGNRFYEGFFEEGEKKDDKPGNVSIRLVFGNVPETKDMMTLFEGGDESWSMYRSGSHHVTRFDRRDSGQTYMLARFGPAVEEVGIFCSEEFVKEGVSTFNPLQYPLDQILLMYHLSSRSGTIVHAAGTVINERGFLFPGQSGSGKTTIMKRLARGKGCLGLSDDRIIVRKMKDSFMIFGTPWPGDAGLAVNKSAPVAGVFFLDKGAENRLEEISGTEAFRRFMPVLSIPWFDREVVSGIFSFVDDLISRVPSYVLHFTPDIEVGFFEKFLYGQ